MYSNHNSLPSANEVFIQNNNVELPVSDNQENRPNDYTKYQGMRHEGRYQPKKSDHKTFPRASKSRAKSVNSGKKFLSVCHNAKFSIFNSKLLGDPEPGLVVNALDCVPSCTGTLDNIYWPPLTLPMKNKDSNQKKRSHPKFSDVSVQTENHNLELIYPLWNTREIALLVKDDIPILKESKVSQGTKIDLSLKDRSIETHSAPAGSRNEKSSAFSFEELVQCFTETRKTSKLKIDGEEKLGRSRMNTENKYSHKGTSDGNSVLKTTTTFVHGSNKRSFCKQNSSNQLQKLHLLRSNERLQNSFRCPYYSCEQVISRATAECIATHCFDIESAINIAYYLGKEGSRGCLILECLQNPLFHTQIMKVKQTFKLCSKFWRLHEIWNKREAKVSHTMLFLPKI